MRRKSFLGGVAAAIALAGLLAGCAGKPPAGPTPYAERLEVTGPSSIVPGQSAQFTATAYMSDGSSRQATDVRWRSSDTSVLQMTASGLATAGLQNGETTVSADGSSGRPAAARSSMQVLVMPDGTYRMVGVVTEADSQAQPVRDARVEVATGPALVASTDWSGRYRLYGVPSDAEIRVTKDGYQPHTQNLRLTSHVTQNFSLALSGMRLELAGDYTLMIDALAGCSGDKPLPDELRHRTYAASVAQNGSALNVVLTEPRFRVGSFGLGRGFPGRIEPAGATFELHGELPGYYYYDALMYPAVVERLPNGTFLIPAGGARTTGSAAGLSGEFSGYLANYAATYPAPGSFIAWCPTTYRFALTPR